MLISIIIVVCAIICVLVAFAFEQYRTFVKKEEIIEGWRELYYRQTKHLNKMYKKMEDEQSRDS